MFHIAILYCLTGGNGTCERYAYKATSTDAHSVQYQYIKLHSSSKQSLRTESYGSSKCNNHRSSEPPCIVELTRYECQYNELIPQKDNVELQLSRQRQWIPSPISNVQIFDQLDSFGGVGLQARVDISSGTAIISEPELFSVTRGESVTTQQASMRDFQTLSGTSRMSRRQERFVVNGFSMAGTRDGIFVESSRFNHSCVPNAVFVWNSNSGQLTEHAIINIPAYAEIFINYRPEDYFDKVQQRSYNLRYYDFQCTCDACQPNTRVGAASAQRRATMLNLKGNIYRNRNATQFDIRNQRLADIKAFSQLLQSESLFYPQLADMYTEEVKWYCREMQLAPTTTEVAGDRYKAAMRHEALETAGRRLDLGIRCTGYISDEVEGALRLIHQVKNQ